MTDLAPLTAGAETPPAVPTFRSAGASALFSRGVVIIAGFGNSLLLPLVLNQRGIGQYFLAQLIIAGLATFCQLGFTFSIPSQVTDAVARKDLGRARGLAATILCFSTGLGVIVVVVVVAASPWIVEFLDPADRATWIAALPIIAAIGSLASLTAVIVELLRAVHAVRAAANLAALASIFAAAYAGLVLAIGERATLSGALFAILLGSVGSVTLGLALFWLRSANWPRSAHKPAQATAVLRETLPNLFTTLVLFGLANLDMLILGSLGSMNEVAQYGLALRFSALMVMPLAIANAAAAPLAVHARSTDDIATLYSILARVVFGGAGVAAVLYIGFAAVGYGFIALWNANYQDAYWLTLLLGLGNVLHACGGAAGVLLMIWGDQSRAFMIVVGTSAVTIILCLLGYRFGGVFGLAVAAAFGNVSQVTCFVLRARARFDVDPSLPGQWRASFASRGRCNPPVAASSEGRLRR
ncbi:oligosaccharide flippase family protein (plasmid) [Bradyrhizobium barranii subsp. barranii]|uniref:Oligosaccharide flippase family protein n=1 Tax=Bradyrhizobium barranii subsp. barranii TaxID=2823807 RepID=A0A939SA86_9BRAD|nr:oligosaccharide flippase family protein [Bradyrhizobium barranii]UEM17954.1 oligosaccharide flippase family protein [Bradyrhizobium barranii subsp. barranii]